MPKNLIQLLKKRRKYLEDAVKMIRKEDTPGLKDGSGEGKGQLGGGRRNKNTKPCPSGGKGYGKGGGRGQGRGRLGWTEKEFPAPPKKFFKKGIKKEKK